jgi:sporulation protein YlmC with PRC-barrel domain
MRRAAPEVVEQSNNRETAMNSSTKATTPGFRTDIWAACYAPDSYAAGRRSVSSRTGVFFATSMLIVLIVFVLAFVVTPKAALSQGVHLVKVDVSVLAHGYRVSKLIGNSVSNDKNERVGSVDDMIVDRNKVMFAVLQVGGFLGLGKHLVAVPYESLQIDVDGRKIVLPGASKDELKALAEFKYPT